MSTEKDSFRELATASKGAEKRHAIPPLWISPFNVNNGRAGGVKTKQNKTKRGLAEPS